MKKYLATDLDGTLLYPRLKYTYVAKENINVINKFDGNTIIVSGRNQSFVKKICKYLNIEETYIACNGACVSHKGKIILTQCIDTDLVNEIIDYVISNFDNYKIILFDTNGKLYSLSDNIEKVKQEEYEYNRQFPKISYKTNTNKSLIKKLLKQKQSIIKFTINLKDNKKIDLYNKLLEKNLPLSYAICKHALEITAKNVTKGDALNYLTNHMKLDSNDVYVIGDDKNDLSMFTNYKNSFLINHGDNLDLSNNVKYVLNKFKDITQYIKEE